jgi:hypothetical protein
MRKKIWIRKKSKRKRKREKRKKKTQKKNLPIVIFSTLMTAPLRATWMICLLKMIQIYFCSRCTNKMTLIYHLLMFPWKSERRRGKKKNSFKRDKEILKDI